MMEFPILNKIYIILCRLLDRLFVCLRPFLIWIVRIKAKTIQLSSIELVDRLKTMLGNPNDYVFESTTDIINQAQEILNHKFSVFSDKSILEDPIDWSQDLKSKYVWPKKYYPRYNIYINDGLTDVKNVWDKSRCHHLMVLAQAYYLTKEEKYAEEIAGQIRTWIRENPLMYSINWTCSMEVAIRAVNWMYSIALISDSNVVNNEFSRLVAKSLYEHGYYIFNNLESSKPYSANHYLSDLSGLIYLGLLFQHNRCGRRWLDFAKPEFDKEIRIQFLPSGMQYERSVSYHRLTTEIVLYTLITEIQSSIPADKDLIERLSRMIETIDFFTGNCVGVPNIGDEDDGRFVAFSVTRGTRYSYFADVYQKFFNCSVSNQSDVIKADAGFASIKNDKYALVISNGGLSKYPEPYKICVTHSHCDLLSFVLSTPKGPFIIDPGTLVYTADFHKRNLYRSTSMHNTLMIDDVEQYALDEHNMFKMRNDSIPGLLFSDGRIVTGSYQTLHGSFLMQHTRSFITLEDSIIIEDTVAVEGSHAVRLFFHIGTSEASIDPDLKSVDFPNLGSKLFFECESPYDIEIVDSFYSPFYGVEKNGHTVVIMSRFDSEFKIRSIIQL